MFALPEPHSTDEVAHKFYDAFASGEGSAMSIAAFGWLEGRHFRTAALPPLVVKWWAWQIPGARDIYACILYDSLHCFFIGLLDWN